MELTLIMVRIEIVYSFAVNLFCFICAQEVLDIRGEEPEGHFSEGD